jgi:hypothetical protein
MRRSFGGGRSLKNILFVNYNNYFKQWNKQVLNVFITKCLHFDGGEFLHVQSSKYSTSSIFADQVTSIPNAKNSGKASHSNR